MAIGTPRVFGGAAFGTAVATATSAADATIAAGERIFFFVTSRSASSFQADPTVSNSGTALTWTKFVTNVQGPATNPFLNAACYWADATPIAGVSTTLGIAGTGVMGIGIIVPMGANPDVTNFVTPTGTTSVATGTLAGSPAAALSIAMANGGGTITQNGAYTVLYNAQPGSGRHAAWYDLSTPATSFTITSPGTNTVGLLMELKEQTAAAGSSEAPVYGLLQSQPVWFNPPPVQPAGLGLLTVTAGVIYSDTVTETAATSDSFTSSATFPNALTETAATSDSFTSTATFANTLTEAATTSDSFTASATFPNSLTETAATSDSFFFPALSPPFSQQPFMAGAEFLPPWRTPPPPPQIMELLGVTAAGGTTYPNTLTDTATTSDSNASQQIGYELLDAASGGLPAAFTARWVTTNNTFVETAGGFLRSTPTVADARHLASINRIDTGAADIEILAIIRSSVRASGSFNTAITVRGTGLSGNEGGYRFALNDTAGSASTQVSKIVAGTATSLGSSLYPWLVNTWYRLRFRVIGTTLQARVWPDGTPEPGAWDYTISDSAVSGAGWNGWMTFLSVGGVTHDLAYISYGTDGATAPDPPYGAIGNEANVAAALDSRFYPPWRAPPPVQLPTILSKTAGGAVYSDSITETAATSDSYTVLATFANTITETAATSDSFAGAASYPNSVSETAATSDAYTVLATFANTLTEAATTSDAYTVLATYTVSLTETAVTSDSFFIFSIAMVSGPQAYVGWRDYQAWIPPFRAPPPIQLSGTGIVSKGTGTIYSDTITETAATSDSFTTSGNTFNNTIVETAQTGDSYTATGGTVISPVLPGGSGSGADRRRKLKKRKKRVVLYQREPGIEPELPEAVKVVRIDPTIIARALGLEPRPTTIVPLDAPKEPLDAVSVQVEDDEEELLALLLSLISDPRQPEDPEEEELMLILQSLL